MMLNSFNMLRLNKGYETEMKPIRVAQAIFTEERQARKKGRLYKSAL